MYSLLLVDLILELHMNDISGDLEVTGEQSYFSSKTILPSTSWGPGTQLCSYAIRTQPWRRTDDLQYAVLNVMNNKLMKLTLSIKWKNMNINDVLQIKCWSGLFFLSFRMLPSFEDWLFVIFKTKCQRATFSFFFFSLLIFLKTSEKWTNYINLLQSIFTEIKIHIKSIYKQFFNVWDYRF